MLTGFGLKDQVVHHNHGMDRVETLLSLKYLEIPDDITIMIIWLLVGTHDKR